MQMQANNDGETVPSIEEGDTEAPRTLERTPLPMTPLIALLLIQMAESITATVIYPFINQFVRETGITGGDETKTGYYAGIIESAFFFAESATVVQWGYLSDRYGRRPILLFAPLGLTVVMLGFGSSTTFWPLVAYRCLQGVFNGNIGVAKSTLAELTDPTNRPDAYALMSFAWSLGLTLAPIMGGTLANAASRWPDTFGRIPYIRTHPYFLPCLVAGAYTFVTFVFDCFALKETLPSIVAKENAKHQNSASVDEETPLLINIQQDQSNYAASQSSSPPPATGLSSTMTSEPTNIPRNSQPHAVLTRPVLLTLANHVCLTFTDMCHYALLPLMYSTPIEYGGLGLDPYHIGIALGAFGLVNAIVQVKTLGPVVRRFGPRRAYRVAYSFLLGIFAMYPILHFLVQRAGRVDGFVIAGIFVQLSFQVMIYMAYGSLQMILVESVPEGGPLGTVNGVGQMLGSGMRCIAPTFATSLFSVSIQRNLAGGNMVYYILLALTVIAVHCSAFLPARPARTSDGRQS